jgi:hypothetical protein
MGNYKYMHGPSIPLYTKAIHIAYNLLKYDNRFLIR